MKKLKKGEKPTKKRFFEIMREWNEPEESTSPPSTPTPLRLLLNLHAKLRKMEEEQPSLDNRGERASYLPS